MYTKISSHLLVGRPHQFRKTWAPVKLCWYSESSNACLKSLPPPFQGSSYSDSTHNYKFDGYGLLYLPSSHFAHWLHLYHFITTAQYFTVWLVFNQKKKGTKVCISWECSGLLRIVWWQKTLGQLLDRRHVVGHVEVVLRVAEESHKSTSCSRSPWMNFIYIAANMSHQKSLGCLEVCQAIDQGFHDGANSLPFHHLQSTHWLGQLF